MCEITLIWVCDLRVVILFFACCVIFQAFVLAGAIFLQLCLTISFMNIHAKLNPYE